LTVPNTSNKPSKEKAPSQGIFCLLWVGESQELDFSQDKKVLEM
jgi:hypothetical protein